MKQALLFIISSILLSSFLFPCTALAGKEEPIGTVVAVRGEVTAVAGSGASRPLAMKGPVFRDDTVRTGNGRVQLMFADNTLISLGSKSEMVIAEYDWQPDGKNGAMKTKIKEGTFRVMGGAITKVAPGNFSTETPAANIGIRGSMYAGKATQESLTVVFQGGKGIDVTNAAGTVAITKPGFGTRVLGLDTPPLPPMRFTAQDLGQIDAGFAEGAGPSSKDGEKPAADEEKPAADGEKPAADGEKPAADGEKPAAEGEKPAADGEKSAAKGEKPTDGKKGPTEGGSSPKADQKSQAATDNGPKGQKSEPSRQGSGKPMATSLAQVEPLPPPPPPPVAPATTIPFAPSGALKAVNDLVKVATKDVEEKKQEDQNNQAEETTVTVVKEALIDQGLVTAENLTGVTDLSALTQVLVSEGLLPAGTTRQDFTITLDGTGSVTITENNPPTETTGPTAPTVSLLAQMPLRQLQGVYNLGSPAESDWDGGTGTINLYDDGTLGGTLADGTVLPAMTIPDFDRTATYSGPPSLVSVEAALQDGSGAMPATVSFGALQNGAFMYWAFDDDLVVDARTFEVSGLGFAGTASSGLPVSGIETYIGQLAHISFNSNSQPIDGGLEDFIAEVNWHNRAIVGRAYESVDGETESDANVFFFGHIDGDPTHIVIIEGHRLNEPSYLVNRSTLDVEAISGNLTSGQLFGASYEGFGFTAEGKSISVQTGALLDTWQAIGAGFMEIETDPAAEVFDSSGTSVFQGFVVGVADNMAGPTAATSRVFVSSMPDQFSFTVDKAAGTISGTLSAYDWNGSGSILSGIEIGGAYASAYVLDDQFAAILGCSTGDCVEKYVSPNYVTGDLKPYGNFLITAGPDAEWEVTTGDPVKETEYLTWGYWEIAYKDPGDNADYHLFGERSLWVAGQRTPQAEIDSLRAGSFTGTYTGGAKGVKTSTMGTESVLGRSNITVAFGPGTVTGSIDFSTASHTGPQYILDINGAFNAHGGFDSYVSNAAETTAVNGAFFGPHAEEIGGNFESGQLITLPDGSTDHIKYLGIFGGSRPAGP